MGRLLFSALTLGEPKRSNHALIGLRIGVVVPPLDGTKGSLSSLPLHAKRALPFGGALVRHSLVLRKAAWRAAIRTRSASSIPLTGHDGGGG